MTTKFVAYYRVSTQEQGDSGLGLASQKSSIQTYIDSINGELITEYTDVETGKNNNRENLWAAVAEAKQQGATLIVKKFDRLSRGGLEVMARLEKLKVTFIESDSPHDNTLLKELKFSIARDEVRRVSERTSAALGVIKSKIENGQQHVSKTGRLVTSLGNPENLTDEARAKGRASMKKKTLTNENNRKAWAFIEAVLKQGVTNKSHIANALNDAGFLTSQGSMFSQVQVSRLIKLYSNV